MSLGEIKITLKRVTKVEEVCLLRRRNGYTQEEKEWLMGEYLRLKKSTGWTNLDLAGHLGINQSTLYEWKREAWYEDLSRRVNWEENTEITTGALNRLNKLINSSDDEVALKALNVFARLNPDLALNRSPSGKEDNSNDGVFNSDLLLARRVVRSTVNVGDGDEDE